MSYVLRVRFAATERLAKTRQCLFVSVTFVTTSSVRFGCGWLGLDPSGVPETFSPEKDGRVLLCEAAFDGLTWKKKNMSFFLCEGMHVCTPKNLPFLLGVDVRQI